MAENQLQKINAQDPAQYAQGLDALKNGGEVLRNLTTRAQKAAAVGARLIADLQALELRRQTATYNKDAGALAQLNQERAALDERCNKFLANCDAAFKEEDTRRAPITQMLAALAQAFIEPLKTMDVKQAGTYAAQVQAYRNNWVRELREAEAEKLRLAKLKEAREKDEATLRASLRLTIATRLNDFLAARKRAILEHFNAITLADFPQKSAGLKSMATEFPADKLAGIFTFPLPFSSCFPPAEVNRFKEAEQTAYDLQAFYTEYAQEIQELKRDLTEKLPAKFMELEEIEAAQKSNPAQAQALQEEQAKREQAERERLQEEQAKRNGAAATQAEVQSIGAGLMASFNNVVTAGSGAAPAAKEQVKLRVVNAAGWAQLLQFWMEGEKDHLAQLKPEDVEAIGKKSFSTLKTYAEKAANRKLNPVRIDSPFLIYETDLQAKTEKL